MDELVQFLRARLDEDERIARAAAGLNWLAEGEWLINEDMHIAEFDDAPTLAHIARHDPARVLREVDAKRQIIECHEPWVAGNGDTICGRCGREHIDGRPGGHFPCQTLRLLALPYADRPGYREEWRP